MSVKIQPNQVYRLVNLLPKEMQVEFNNEAFVDVANTDEEFVPDADRRYDHSLGLSWLTKHKIPNTIEELEAQRQYVFQTMISGPDTYNVGQFIVVFPSIIYGTRDLGESVLVLEVMDELEFPPMPDMVVPFNAEIRAASYDDVDRVALRHALECYVATGKIKVHTAGIRVYGGTESYKFQERFTPVEEERLSFQEIIRRNRRS